MSVYLTLLTAGILLSLALSACGSDSTKSAGSTSTTGASPQSASERAVAVRRFGHEAGASRAHRAEVALHGYFTALAASEWHAACSHLTRQARQLRAHLAEAEQSGGSCASGLRVAVRGRSASIRALAKAVVFAVRLKGRRGYILYSHATGSERAMPVEAAAHGAWELEAFLVDGMPIGASG